MQRLILAGVLVLALATPIGGQQPSLPAATAALPTDSALHSGTLSNGLRYYIRRNGLPAKRAELRLVVNVGSVLERKDQLGYAHFLEHTAFNGTTHFAKNDLVSYLQTIGVKFGADLNASTALDETIYILPVPTDSVAIVSRAFEILGDWARGQTLDSLQVVGERGVVREEWRGRKGAGDRVLRQILPVVLKGSLYAERLPIGTEASIMGAQPSGLRTFYDRWYRPDLMAVIAVGDFDPAVIERDIRAQFGRIPRARGPAARPTVVVPDNAAPLVVVASDKELTSTSVEVTYKGVARPTRTAGDYRRDLLGQLYTGMLNARFSEIAQKPDAPFLGASASKGGFFARATSAFDLSAGVRDGGAARGLEALLAETRRVDRFGFLQSELDRAKANLLRSYERAYAERDRTTSSALVQEYIDNFLRGDATPSIATEYELVQAMLPTIALADVNSQAKRWITDKNRLVVVAAPDKPGLALPTPAQLLAAFDRAAAAPTAAYVENVSNEALLAHVPAPGRITASRMLTGTDVVEWTLGNGARVLVKPTDFKADEVLFGAYAPGGTSLAADADYMSASMATQLVSLGGVGAFSRVDLGKKLSGKAVRLQPTMSETSEGLSGSASPKDLETLLQLAYLQFTSPREDTSAYAAFRNQIGPFLQNRGADPGSVFGDTVAVVMSQHDFRTRPLGTSTFAEVSLDRAFAFYRARFADAGAFTFVFVGNVDTTTLRPLVERYLASLPGVGRKEAWAHVSKGPPAGPVEVTVRKGRENKATTVIAFTGPMAYTPENRFALRALTDYLQIRLTETLREQLGGSYSPSVGSRSSDVPRAEYAIQVLFSSSPENVGTLTPAVDALIDTLLRAGPSATDVEKVQAQMIRQRETDLKQNAYWFGNILARSQSGEDIAGLAAPYDRMIHDLTPAVIHQAARRYLDTKNRARFVLLPEIAGGAGAQP